MESEHSDLYERRQDGERERVETRGDQVTRGPVHPRDGWGEAFALMAARGDDRLLDADAATSSWDEEEWQWPAAS